MFEGSKWYRMKDAQSGSGMVEIPTYAAEAHNRYQNGIFFSINSFEGSRQIVNLKHLNAWYAETDNVPKKKVLQLIDEAPIKPSVLVESKNGYHMYWRIEGDCTLDQYREAQGLLSDYFEGDPLKDVTRVLRVPGYMHWKDPEDPFLVREIWNRESRTTFEELRREYGGKEPEVPKISKTARGLMIPRKAPPTCSTDWGQRLRAWDVRDGLARLSGTDAVKGDTYGLDENANGSTQIVVNGHRSSSWIDSRGDIGSHKRWGPNLYAWLSWYWDRDNVKVKEIFDEYFDDEMDVK